MTMDSLNRLVNAFQQRQRTHPRNDFQRVLVHWAEVVGAVVAAKTRPLQLQNRTLWVAVPASVWAQNLSFERHLLLQKLNPHLSVPLRDIRFSTAGWSGDRPTLPVLEMQQQLEAWENHPSRLPISPVARPVLSNASAHAQFRHYATWRQQQNDQLPLCRSCHCPTPPGEIERWGCCALCARRCWSS
jgi:predicted nucleic acid-binding Zn ribbon protein